MIDLTNPDSFKELDPKNVYASTELFTNQCLQVISDHFDFRLPEQLNFSNIVFCGMGGSAHGPRVALSLYSKELSKPVELVSGYHLPGYVDNKTLVILISYSGSTEEVLSCASEAASRGATIMGFCAGGKLGEVINSNSGFIFDPKNNPSGQPRLGIGYMVMGTLVTLIRTGVLSLTKDELTEAVGEVNDSKDKVKSEARKQTANFKGKIPLIISADHLKGVSHVLRNHLNETSKTFSYFEEVPELNHHLMEGLKFPNPQMLKTLILQSNYFEKVIKNRLILTKDVFSKNSITVEEFEPNGKTTLADCLISLSFASYFSLYLGLIYGEDPSLIPWVDYFKKELQKLA